MTAVLLAVFSRIVARYHSRTGPPQLLRHPPNATGLVSAKAMDKDKDKDRAVVADVLLLLLLLLLLLVGLVDL